VYFFSLKNKRQMLRSLSKDATNIEKLTSVKNYLLWKFQIEILFKANNLYEVMISNRPEPTDKWKKCSII